MKEDFNLKNRKCNNMNWYKKASRMKHRIDFRNALSPEQIEEFRSITGKDVPEGYELVNLDGLLYVLRPERYENETEEDRLILAPEDSSKFPDPGIARSKVRDQGLSRIRFVETPEAIVAQIFNIMSKPTEEK
jgi:hypothetical protein